MILSCTLGILKGQSTLPECLKKKKFKPNFYLTLDKYGIESPSKNNNLELRIWLSSYSSGQRQLIRLLEDKTGTWTAQYLEFYYYNPESNDLDDYILDTLEISDSWLESWKQINQKKLLCINTQEELHKQYMQQVSEVMITADGENWLFEVYSKKTKWAISYSNPTNYYSFYKDKGVDVTDYEKVTELVKLIMKEFDWTHRIKGVSDR